MFHGREGAGQVRPLVENVTLGLLLERAGRGCRVRPALELEVALQKVNRK